MGRTRELRVNCGKRLAVEVGGRAYARIPIKTHVITAADDIVDVVQRYAGPLLHSEDMLVISEKVVSIAQQRAYPIGQIKPSWLARVLAEFVYKSPHGIGLGSPWTMELAIREAGPLRVVAAAAVAGVAKVFGAGGCSTGYAVPMLPQSMDRATILFRPTTATRSSARRSPTMWRSPLVRRRECRSRWSMQTTWVLRCWESRQDALSARFSPRLLPTIPSDNHANRHQSV